ncbi:MAG: SCO family protein [Deltaproteobacteria bacterium]|nr:SCO family protein [Deltaproteobacteria bacterium]
MSHDPVAGGAPSSAPSSDDGAHPAAEPRRPIWRNPYVWAAIGGMAAMTALRPCLRRVPAPPPVVAKLPAYRLEDTAGRPSGSAELAGQVYHLALVRMSCAVHCVPVARALKTLIRRYDYMKIPVQLVAVAVDPPAEARRGASAYLAQRKLVSPRLRLLSGPPEALKPLLEALARASGFAVPKGTTVSELEALAHQARLYLIDAAGNLRGSYRTDELGTDEAYHRGLHVWLPKP